MLLYINGKLDTENGIAINYSKLVKKGDTLTTYVDGSKRAKLSGIYSWNVFEVRGGEIVEDIDNDEILLDNIMEMKLDNSKYVVEKKSILHELMEIKLKLMKGGL